MQLSRREPHVLHQLVDDIRRVGLTRRVRLMEVCGGHTAAIHQSALHSLLPPEIELISGPGCPVCVTPGRFVDQAVSLSGVPGVTITTFGDLLRVPGTHGSLADARARGADVRVIYSAREALDLAKEHPERVIVLLGIGFETTACVIAAVVDQAAKENVLNFRMFSALKTMPAALRVLLSESGARVSGLILPGHVMTVTGTRPFDFIAHEFRLPCAVAGFEPEDLLEAIRMISDQLAHDTAALQIQYRRSVSVEGNRHAQEMITRVLEPGDATWRGLGVIADSGLSIRPEYRAWDACDLVPDTSDSEDDSACRCGDVLRGIIRPAECRLFGIGCSPESPQGACMVSSEGACAAAYHYA